MKKQLHHRACPCIECGWHGIGEDAMVILGKDMKQSIEQGFHPWGELAGGSFLPKSESLEFHSTYYLS
eukprot:scaffold300471_cov39-Tisochrysis_lutea.AAC.5